MESEIKRYNEHLRIANETESQDEGKCLTNLESCLEMIDTYFSDEERFSNDKTNIECRIKYLHDKGIKKSELTQKEVDAVEEEIVPAEEPEVVKEEIILVEEAEVVEEEIKPAEEAEDAEEVQDAKVAEESETEELRVPDFSDVSPAMEVSDPSDIPKVPDVVIIQNMYDLLLNSEEDGPTPTYDDYISFYSSMNDLYEKLQGPILYQQGGLVYYVGDTHGSYNETRVMIKYFEQIIKRRPEVRIVYDGDYVDRNPQDLENLTLIVAFFLQYPQNVSILRGNHEDTMINQHYGFLKNLRKAFLSEAKVSTLYGQILTMFTRLPIMHVFSLESEDPETSAKRIFTVHGGIPIDEHNPTEPVMLGQLENEINPEVPSYESFDKKTSWLLWSDPKEKMEGFELHPETGRNYFGQDMFDQFMKANNLDFMVRAHEVLKNGSKFFFGKRLLSLFSTSFYKNHRIGDGAFARFKASGDALVPDLLPMDSTMLDIDLATME